MDDLAVEPYYHKAWEWARNLQVQGNYSETEGRVVDCTFEVASYAAVGVAEDDSDTGVAFLEVFQVH